MPKLLFNKAKFHRDENGLWLALLLDKDRENIKKAQKFMGGIKDRLYSAVLDIFRKQRSIRANNYAWELIGNIAEILEQDKGEIYHQMLVSYGTIKQVGDTVMTTSIPAAIDLTMETEEYLYIHTAFIGQNEINGVLVNHYRIIKGSSEYDTKEMSVFIDGVVWEAQELGIETKTPDEIARIKTLVDAA